MVAGDNLDNKFTVVVVGTEGAGKTAYLAALYNALFTDPDGRGYHIATDMATAEWLNPIAEKIRTPGPEWPSSTAWVKTELDFRCFVPTVEGTPLPVLHIRYIDYPGQYLRETPEGAEGQRDTLQAAIRAADALLAIVDGREVLALLRGEDRGHTYVRTRLEPTIQRVQDTSVPVHLLLTKWDLVVDAGFSLGDVRDRLLDIDFVRGMVRTRRPVSTENRPAHGGVRLVPVSVIGRGVAEPRMESNGVEIMVKKAGVPIKPINLDVPLAAILPDQVERVLASFSPREMRRARRAARRLRHREARHGFLWFAGEALAIAGRPLELLIAPVLGRASSEIGRLFIEYAAYKLANQAAADTGRDSDEGRENERRDTDGALRRLEPMAADAGDALRSLLNSFDERVRAFEEGHPGWNLLEGLDMRQSRHRGTVAS